MDVAVFCATGVAVVLLIWVGPGRRFRWAFGGGLSFAEKFPPISDDEFVACCTPGTSRRVALTVRRIVAEHLAIDYGRIHPSMRFVEDIGGNRSHPAE